MIGHRYAAKYAQMPVVGAEPVEAVVYRLPCRSQFNAWRYLWRARVGGN